MDLRPFRKEYLSGFHQRCVICVHFVGGALQDLIGFVKVCVHLARGTPRGQARVIHRLSKIHQSRIELATLSVSGARPSH